jgi:hypothetical protein
MSSRKFQISRLQTEFVKLLISIQLGENLFNGTLHKMELRKVIVFAARYKQPYVYLLLGHPVFSYAEIQNRAMSVSKL